MLSKKTVVEYQRMSPEGRFKIATDLTDEAYETLDALPPDVRDLRWREIRRDHDESRELVPAHLAKHAR